MRLLPTELILMFFAVVHISADIFFYPKFSSARDILLYITWYCSSRKLWVNEAHPPSPEIVICFFSALFTNIFVFHFFCFEDIFRVYSLLIIVLYNIVKRNSPYVTTQCYFFLLHIPTP